MLTNFRADRRVGARSRRRGSAFEGRSAHAPALDQRRAARGHGDGRDGRPVGAAGAGQRDGGVRDRRGGGVGHRGVRRAGGVPAGRGGARGARRPAWPPTATPTTRPSRSGCPAAATSASSSRRWCRSSSRRSPRPCEAERPVAYLTTIGGEVTGNPRVIGGEGEPADEAEAAARPLLEMGESGVVTVGGDDVFVSSFVPGRRCTCSGRSTSPRPCAPSGKFLGYRVTVCDPRAIFVTPERFPDADELVTEWPHEFLATAPVDARTAVCVLTHDAKFDVPALQGGAGHARPLHRRDGLPPHDRAPAREAARGGRGRGPALAHPRADRPADRVAHARGGRDRDRRRDRLGGQSRVPEGGP